MCCTERKSFFYKLSFTCSIFIEIKNNVLGKKYPVDYRSCVNYCVVWLVVPIRKFIKVTVWIPFSIYTLLPHPLLLCFDPNHGTCVVDKMLPLLF